MPVAHVLQRLNAHHLADVAARDGLKDLLKERRIAQHMADDHAAARFPRRPLDQLHVGLRRGNRLLQQQVVALFHRRHRVANVHRVLRADERHVSQALAGKHLLARLKAHVRRDVVAPAHSFALFRNRLGHGGDHHPVGEHLAHRRIGVLAAAAQAANRHTYGIAHIRSSFKMQKRGATALTFEQRRRMRLFSARRMLLRAMMHEPKNPHAVWATAQGSVKTDYFASFLNSS